MTNDFDDLASAYIDGQLTENETARVEGDPELQARVDELRSVSEALNVDVSPVDETLKRRQLNAAMAAFDQLETESTGPATEVAKDNEAGAVADLGQRRADKEAAKGPTSTGRGRAGLPSWLGVAAGLLLLVGGIGFLSQVTGGSDDETAAFDTADSSESAGEAAEEESLDVAESPLATGGGDEAMEDDAAASAMVEDEEAADDASADEDADEGSVDTSTDDAEEASEDEGEDGDDRAGENGEGPPTTSSPAGGLFPSESVEEARVLFGEIPDDAAVASLARGDLLAPSLSLCATEGELADGRPIVGFIPIAVDDLNGEVLFVEVEPEPSAVVLTEACSPFE